MVDSGFGKKIEETSSSSTSSIPLITRRWQLGLEKSPQTQVSTEVKVSKKAINILRSEHPEYRRMARNKLLTILMERPNPDVGKDVMVDINSEDEFDETLDEI